MFCTGNMKNVNVFIILVLLGGLWVLEYRLDQSVKNKNETRRIIKNNKECFCGAHYPAGVHFIGYYSSRTIVPSFLRDWRVLIIIRSSNIQRAWKFHSPLSSI